MKLIRKIIVPITIILFLIFIVLFVNLKMNLNVSKYDEIEVVDNIIKDEIVEEKQNKYSVDVKGAVNNPGVYIVDSNLTVNDVINIAGGLNKDADTSVINLAKKIVDEMVVIVYTKDEVKNSNVVDTVIKVVEKECVCPNIQNDSCLNTEITDEITNAFENGLVNINTATSEMLQTIKGIGKSKADSIVSYRENNGKFEKIEDIKNVDGIGDSLYESIKVYITT